MSLPVVLLLVGVALAQRNISLECEVCTQNGTLGFYKVIWLHSAPTDFICRDNLRSVFKQAQVVAKACTPNECQEIVNNTKRLTLESEGCHWRFLDFDTITITEDDIPGRLPFTEAMCVFYVVFSSVFSALLTAIFMVVLAMCPCFQKCFVKVWLYLVTCGESKKTENPVHSKQQVYDVD